LAVDREDGGRKARLIGGIDYGELEETIREVRRGELVDLYTEDGTKLAGKSISSGSLATKPLDVLSYREWELLIWADQDFTVEIQILTPTNNWRTFDTYSSPTGSKRLHLLVDEHLPTVRLIITPSVYPMTVLDAFVVLVP